MSRVIKFEFLYRGMPYRAENQDAPWFKKHYTLSQLIEKPLHKLSDVHSLSELIAKRQFTGLTDKNGVEIYENDIVTDEDGAICTVEFHGFLGSCSCCYTAFEGSGFAAFNAKDQSVYLTNCKVIGNIHQNPELLEQVK